MYTRGLMIFRQDLRLTDNTALQQAIVLCKEVSYLFVVDTTILARGPAHDPRVGFVLDAVYQLHAQILERGGKPSIMYGDGFDCAKQFCIDHRIDAMFRNRSYGKGSQTRDRKLIERATTSCIATHDFPDYLIIEPNEIPVRKVFSPFAKLWKKTLLGVPHADAPVVLTHRQIVDGLFACQTPDALPAGPFQDEWKKITTDRPVQTHPLWRADGRVERFDTFAFGLYDHTRNIPSIDGSTKLSPYLRFGLVSARQVYNRIVEVFRRHDDPTTDASCTTLVNELIWREFWHHIAFHFPQTMTEAFQEKRRGMVWDASEQWIQRWRDGMTGFPMVDAGMRQLRQENWMHNRVRMVVASFFTKHMHGDRRLGEEIRSQYLLDHDKAINMGNRQWSASVGADPKPVRIFNPHLQVKRFDPTGEYIKRYIPELAKYLPKQLADSELYDLTAYGYPAPMFSHNVQREKTLEKYKKGV